MEELPTTKRVLVPADLLVHQELDRGIRDDPHLQLHTQICTLPL